MMLADNISEVIEMSRSYYNQCRGGMGRMAMESLMDLRILTAGAGAGEALASALRSEQLLL
ncbi:Uncharacterised protein [Mycobacteroides abscessus subsp. abscessus]|nr:Uncharacterised protein [Mycobacteroides abscessus subsp. abscessus]